VRVALHPVFCPPVATAPSAIAGTVRPVNIHDMA
jgi:hypothetical protein